jgi:hypothetical protein
MENKEIDNFKILLDEDNFTEKFQKLPKEEREKYIRLSLLICHCASDFQKENMISKTINHRIHWLLDIFNNNNNLVSPSEFKELFDIKPINITFFKNALNRFWKIVDTKKGKEIFLENLKVHKELYSYTQKGGLNSSQP